MEATQQGQGNRIDPTDVQKSDQCKIPKTKEASFFGRVIKVIYEIVTFIPKIIWSCIKCFIHDREVRPQAPIYYQEVTSQEELERALTKNTETIGRIIDEHDGFNKVKHVYTDYTIAENRLNAEKEERSREQPADIRPEASPAAG